MAINYTYNKINEDGSKTPLTLQERFALLQTWLDAQPAEVRTAYTAAHARTLAMLAGQDVTVSVHPPVDAEWKTLWDRFLSEAGVEQILADA